MSTVEALVAKLGPDNLIRLWHRRAVGQLTTIVASITSLALASDFGGRSPSPLGLGLCLVTTLLTGTVWFLTTRLPKTAPGRVGFVLSLYSESEDEDQRVRSDFVDHLRSLLLETEASQFQLLLIPRALARDVNDTESAVRLLGRTKGHFIAYGRVRRRIVDGAPVHVLTCEGMVRHMPAAEEVRRDLVQDFAAFLPRRVHFPEENDFFHFETTSEWLEVAARYTIGLAAFISGDARYAEHQFLTVERRLRTGRSRRPPALESLGSRVGNRLLALYRDWHMHLARETSRSPFSGGLPALEAVANKLLERDPDCYPALLSLAMTDFALRRDLKAAFAKIGRCKRGPNAAWRYSLAFLYAYEGNLSKAREEYKYAFESRRIDVELPVQVEEFINAVLEHEPSRAHLHFANALINEHVKEDAAAAIHHYARFIEGTEPRRFPEEHRLAATALGRLRTIDVERE